MTGAARLGLAWLALALVACAGDPSTPPVTAATQGVELPGPPRDAVQQALETLPSGRTVTWRHQADADISGLIRPVRTFRTAQGFCREYMVTARAPDGSARVWQDVACRSPDGVWQAPAAQS